jgi:ribosome-associated protein YbcJ (S4-like RNA binding protein)
MMIGHAMRMMIHKTMIMIRQFLKRMSMNDHGGGMASDLQAEVGGCSYEG